MLLLFENQLRVITKLQNYRTPSNLPKGKAKLIDQKNRQNQSTTGKLGNPQWPWLGTGISKEMVGWIKFYGAKHPASIMAKRFIACHYLIYYYTPSKERKNIWKYYFCILSRSQNQNELKYSVYVRVDILLPFGQHMHDRITSLRGEVSVYKDILTPPLFIEVPVLIKENPQLYMCV